jgi:hypothetical protein
MSIRYLAIQLYEAEKRLDELKRRLRDASHDARAELQFEIHKAEKKRDLFRATLEAKKEPPEYGKPR